MTILLLSYDLLRVIASFLIEPHYKSLDWISEDFYSMGTVFDKFNTITRTKC